MTLYYEQYLRHFQSGQDALREGRNGDARRELLLASRFLLELAREGGDDELRSARVQKGLKLKSMAEQLSAKESTPKATNGKKRQPGLSAGGDEPVAAEQRWQVDEKPNVFFHDIAGLTDVKDVIRRRVLLPLKNPDLAEQYRRRAGGGVLMYGPPGTGKTMMAKAIATELDAPFYSVQSSDIMSKWVGEAEQNLKSLFEAARQRLPSVIFFDETEALIARRGGHSTVMNRVIPEFLAQVDGLKSGPGGLLLLGATNRPWDLDSAALRHGRFGEHIYVRLPDLEARRHMIQATLNTIPLADDVNLGEIATRTESFSGADLNLLIDRIVDPAFDRAMQSGQKEPVTGADVERALATTRPSINPLELKRYERFHQSGE